MYFEQGAVFNKILNEKISFLQSQKDDQMYYSERNGPSNFGYFFPKLADGRYVFILNFVESHHDWSGQRIFNVNIGFSPVITDIDIYSKVGKYRLYKVFIEFSLNKGIVYFKVTLVIIIRTSQ